MLCYSSLIKRSNWRGYALVDAVFAPRHKKSLVEVIGTRCDVLSNANMIFNGKLGWREILHWSLTARCVWLTCVRQRLVWFRVHAIFMCHNNYVPNVKFFSIVNNRNIMVTESYLFIRLAICPPLHFYLTSWISTKFTRASNLNVHARPSPSSEHILKSNKNNIQDVGKPP